MSQLRYLFPRLGAGLCLLALLSSSSLAPAGESDNQNDGNRAKNLARLNVGARIERISPGGKIVSVAVNDNPAALVLDDNTLSCPLTLGNNTFIVTLSRIALLERFAIINQNAAAEGEFEVAVSNYRLGSQDPKWKQVQATTPFTGKRLVSLPVVGTEAKYVRLTFTVRKEGRLAGLGLYGTRTLESFAARHILRAQHHYNFASTRAVARPEDTLVFNFANQYARAHVAYVSSGSPAAAVRLIDDDVATSFAFSPRDEQPTIIIALAEAQKLHRVSIVFQAGQEKMEVYLLNELGENPGELRGLTPVATVENSAPGDGQAAVNFPTQSARFIAVRWKRSKSHARAFAVAEIAGFSGVPVSVFDMEETSNAWVDAGTRKPGEGGTDFSNSLGTLAVPPVLGPVSP